MRIDFGFIIPRPPISMEALKFLLYRPPSCEIPGPYILEIGCNDGRDTQRFLDAFSDCRIYCFEPCPRAAARFRERISDSRVVQLIEAGVSDIDGFLTWYGSHGAIPDPSRVPGQASEVYEDWDLSGSFQRPTGHIGRPDWLSFRIEGELPTVRLDTWIAGRSEIGVVDFIWCDCQGHERQVIVGGRETLRRSRWLYTEVYEPRLASRGCDELYEDQPNLEELLDLLPDFDLVAYFTDENVLLKNRVFPL